VQLTARDEPKTKPKPPATLQVSTPALTACACAGVCSAKAAAANTSALIATFILLSIPSTLLLARSPEAKPKQRVI